MKKTLLILASLLPFAAHGQDLTCQSVLENADGYIPALCDHTHDALPGDYLTLGEPYIQSIEEPKMDWPAARKLCDRHIIGSETHGFDGVTINTYDDKFQEACASVDAHFAEEKHREEVAYQIQADAQAAKDLKRLNDFLAEGTTK